MKKQKCTIGAVVFWCVMALSGAAWCGDGTVTVNGLVWLKDAGCLYLKGTFFVSEGDVLKNLTHRA